MTKTEMIEHEKPKEMTVSTEKLDKVLERLDSLEKENDILKKSVSTAKYNFEREKLEKDKVMRVRFKLHKGVPIVALKSLEQSLIKSPVTGQIVNESIRYKYKLADGEEIEKPYVDFYTTIEHTEAHVIEKRKERDYMMYDGSVRDEVICTCEFIDPSLNDKYGKIDVAISYVNM